jgi:hypothetical protein
MSHDNFAATAKSAEQIDALAKEARQRLKRDWTEEVVGHFDWR